jgi:transcriptional regulator of acetoin/glycerol metabolism
MAALDEAGWDVGAAAVLLGVHRATVYRRIARLRRHSQFN